MSAAGLNGATVGDAALEAARIAEAHRALLVAIVDVLNFSAPRFNYELEAALKPFAGLRIEQFVSVHGRNSMQWALIACAGFAFLRLARAGAEGEGRELLTRVKDAADAVRFNAGFKAWQREP